MSGSAYSNSPPIGKPRPKRVSFILYSFNSLSKKRAVVSPSGVGLVAIIISL